MYSIPRDHIHYRSYLPSAFETVSLKHKGTDGTAYTDGTDV